MFIKILKYIYFFTLILVSVSIGFYYGKFIANRDKAPALCPMHPPEDIKEVIGLLADCRINLKACEKRKAERSSCPLPTHKKSSINTENKKIEVNKNRISLKGGIGPNGVKVNNLSQNLLQFSSNYGTIFGIEYSRIITGPMSVGVTVLNNNSCLLGVGYDF